MLHLAKKANIKDTLVIVRALGILGGGGGGGGGGLSNGDKVTCSRSQTARQNHRTSSIIQPVYTCSFAL